MALKNIPKKDEEKRRFKNLTEMNRHIFTEKFGEDKAKKLMHEIEKLEILHHPSINKFPI